MTEEAIKRIEKDVKEIKEAIVGSVENDGKVGLKGQIALVKQSLGRAWWVIGGISFVILGSAVGLIWGG